MKRLIFVLTLTTLLFALTSTVVYASDPVSDEPEPEKSTGIEEIVGTLGLYAAMMAVLAVGTEVVIDMVRPVFGLQRKMTTEEAFTKLNAWLPGAVKDLGLPKEAETRLEATMKELKETTEKWGAQVAKAEQARRIIQEHWPEILKSLAVQSVDAVLKEYWDKIKGKLEGAGLDTTQLETMHAWLAGALNQLQGTSVTDVQSQLTLLEGLLKGVKDQRNEVQSPLRKFWRWLRGRLIAGADYLEGKGRLPGFIRHVLLLPAYLEYGWARFLGTRENSGTIVAGIRKLGEVQFKSLTSIQEAATRILEADREHSIEEGRRVKWLRIISAAVGIALAAALQIDSLQLLEPILGNAADAFRPAREAAETIESAQWYSIEQVIEQRFDLEPDSEHLAGVLALLLSLTPGVYLSGLGAAAGSGFWHDQLDKLRMGKQITKMAEQIQKPAVGQGEGE